MTTGNISSAAASVLLLLMKMTKATKTLGISFANPEWVGGGREGDPFDHVHFLPGTV